MSEGVIAIRQLEGLLVSIKLIRRTGLGLTEVRNN